VNKDQVVEISRLSGCENFVRKRKQFEFSSDYRFENRSNVTWYMRFMIIYSTSDRKF